MSWTSVHSSSGTLSIGSVLHMIMYICQCYFLSSPRSFLPTLSPQVRSLRLHLHSFPVETFQYTFLPHSSQFLSPVQIFFFLLSLLCKGAHPHIQDCQSPHGLWGPGGICPRSVMLPQCLTHIFFISVHFQGIICYKFTVISFRRLNWYFIWARYFEPCLQNYSYWIEEDRCLNK